MAETKTSWFFKTMGLVILAAVVTSVLTTWLQHLIWGQSSPAIAGGAAAGVAVAIAMARRRDLPTDKPPG